ncbi:MAG TPA: DegV family protein, partial [Candidatus Dormibacteraeota bacterium]
MKRPFAVVTDSTADLPDVWRERYGIEVVPLKVLFGEETFRDRVDMTDEEFFRRL